MYLTQSLDQFSQKGIFGNLRFKVSSLLKLGMCKISNVNIVNEKTLLLLEGKDTSLLRFM